MSRSPLRESRTPRPPGRPTGRARRGGRRGWIVLVVTLLAAGVAAAGLFRGHPPGGTYRSVGRVGSFRPGTAVNVNLPGNVFVGAAAGHLYAVEEDGGCPLCARGGRYVDCRGAVYGLNGVRLDGRGSLDSVPLQVYGGTVYVDPDHPVAHAAGPPPVDPVAPCS